MGIFDKLFKKKNKKIEYQKDWVSYFSNVNDELASIAIDLGITSIAPIAEHKVLLNFSLKMKIPREDGLSSSEEAPKLWDIEDDIINNFKELNIQFYYVGRLTTTGIRGLYFYIDNTILAVEGINKTMQKFENYEYFAEHSNDTNWNKYFDFLYPTPRQMQSVQNDKVLQQLEKGGDNLTKEREITHWIYFNSQTELNHFEEFTKEKLFNTINKCPTEKDTSEFSFVLVISRIDNVTYNEINSLTIELWEKANSLNGNYDGWETSIEK